MKLESVRLRNFRGYVDATVHIDDLTALVGRNDAGKSTVLEGLGAFFGQVSIDPADLNRLNLETTIEIRCTFSELPEDLVVDESAPTTLAEEFLLNEDGKLEISRRWKIGGKITTEVFAHALHPAAPGIGDLLSLKIDQLKARVDEQKLAVEDKRKAPLLRRALRDAVEDKRLVMKDISLADGDGKKVWDRIERELPVFVLFKADRASSDEDNEAQDPMKLAVKEALASVAAELQRVRDVVQQRVSAVAMRTVEELKKIDGALAAQLEPTFRAEPKWDGLFKLSLTGDNDIPLNKRGSGVKRLVLLSFLLAEVERRRVAEDRSSVIIAVEEPETALHPKQQELLVETLFRLSKTAGTQVLLTTHSPALAALLPHASLRLVKRAGPDALAEVEHVKDTPGRVAEELGVLPDPRRNVQIVVCVEGPYDAAFFHRAATLLREVDPTLPDLEGDERIVVLPLGGGTLKHWVENRYLQKLGVPEVHVYDRDEQNPPKYQAAVDAVNARTDGSKAFLTVKRELENYYPRKAIEVVLGFSLAGMPLHDECDVCKVLAPPVWETKNPGTFPQGNPKLLTNCADRLKARLASDILDALDPQGLRDTGFFDEFKVWMQPVASALEARRG